DGVPVPAFEWFFNGRSVDSWSLSPSDAGMHGRVVLQSVDVADAGIYSLLLTRGAEVWTMDSIFGISSEKPIDGDGSIVATNIVHPNGNVYDQMLLEGPAAVITAAPDKVTRISFI